MAASRRRQLITGLAIAATLVGAAGWMQRPIIDQRLVGQWTIDNAGPSWPDPMIEFRSDGTGMWWSSYIPQNRTYSPSPLRWSMSGDRLIWRFEHASLTDAVFREYDRLRYRFWVRSSVAPHENVLEVIEHSGDEVHVEAVANDNTRHRWILRRTD